jgi:hypothetical protein
LPQSSYSIRRLKRIYCTRVSIYRYLITFSHTIKNRTASFLCFQFFAPPIFVMIYFLLSFWLTRLEVLVTSRTGFCLHTRDILGKGTDFHSTRRWNTYKKHITYVQDRQHTHFSIAIRIHNNYNYNLRYNHNITYIWNEYCTTF